MKIRTFLAITVVGGLLAGCGSGHVADLNIQEWVGYKEAELVQAYGKPHHSYKTPDGGEQVGYYFENHSMTGPKQTVHNFKSCMVNFEVYKAGRITDASATGTNCQIGRHEQMHPKAS